MRGSTSWQVTEVFKSIDRIGDSKHAAKAAARDAGANTWHEVGKAVGVHSHSTMEDYKAISRQMFESIKAEYGVRDITKIDGNQVAGWLADKVSEGVARATFDKYAAAAEKLEVALNTYNKSHGIERSVSFDLKEVRALAAAALGTRNDESRAYQDPKSLVENIRNIEVIGKGGKVRELGMSPTTYAKLEKNDSHKLVAEIQRESGARINESYRIFEHQLKGIKADPATGQPKGWIEVRGKGGKIREVGVSPATYAKLEAALAERGRTTIDKLCGLRPDSAGKIQGWIVKTGAKTESAISPKTYAKLARAFVPGSRMIEVNKKSYGESLKRAAVTSKQQYQGSHGLRWSWAQARHIELQTTAKLTYEQALSRISQEMGHERSDITCHYLH